MPVLYVTQVGAQLRKRGERCAVEFRGQTLASLPLRQLERVVLLGPAQLSAGLVHALLKQQVPVVFCSQRGRCHGTLAPGSVDAELMLAQVAAHNDPEYRLALAQSLVVGKITHQQRLLARHARNHPNPSLDEAGGSLARYRARVGQARDVAEVMGLEGQASAVYFAVFGLCLRQEGLGFSGRNRRPPRDPVNALLSLGYMLTLAEVAGALMAQGLHPGLGFLHATNRRHAALALDLLELARQPVADRLTLSLLNRGVLTPGDFSDHTAQRAGVRLVEAALRRYLEFYDRAMTTPFRHAAGQTTLRGWLLGQAELLRRAILGRKPFKPEVLEL